MTKINKNRTKIRINKNIISNRVTNKLIITIIIWILMTWRLGINHK